MLLPEFANSFELSQIFNKAEKNKFELKSSKFETCIGCCHFVSSSSRPKVAAQAPGYPHLSKIPWCFRLQGLSHSSWGVPLPLQGHWELVAWLTVTFLLQLSGVCQVGTSLALKLS